MRRELFFDAMVLKIEVQEIGRGRIPTGAFVTSTERLQDVFRSEADAET